MSLQVKPQEKKKRRTKSSSQPPSFSLLPDEIIVSCLARISRSYYPTLSVVSKSFKSLVSSTELYTARSHLGKQCLYVCLMDYNARNPQLFMLWDNPNRTLLNSSIIKKKKTISPLLVRIPPPSNSSAYPIITLGSEIYGIQTHSFGVRILDCRSHTWRDGPNMNVARLGAFSCVYDGKIYVLGGYKEIVDGRYKELEDDEPWAEVFDTKTHTWECLPDPGTDIRKLKIHKIQDMEGKITFKSFNKLYAYDTKQCKWERCEKASASSPMSECVIENVLYRCFHVDESMCKWYDITDGKWKEVRGLSSLQKKYRRNCGSAINLRKLVSCGGKLLIMWEEEKTCGANAMKKIWCAKIMLEKRDGGKVWGNVEWVDVVHTSPPSWHLSHCLPVSV